MIRGSPAVFLDRDGTINEDSGYLADPSGLRLLSGAGLVPLSRLYYCPPPPEGAPPFRQVCHCRKPQGGLVERAAREHKIDLSRSYVVGDQLVDIELARQSGMTAILVLTGQGRLALESGTVEADHVATDLAAAARWILGRHVG